MTPKETHEETVERILPFQEGIHIDGECPICTRNAVISVCRMYLLQALQSGELCLKSEVKELKKQRELLERTIGMDYHTLVRVMTEAGDKGLYHPSQVQGLKIKHLEEKLKQANEENEKLKRCLDGDALARYTAESRLKTCRNQALEILEMFTIAFDAKKDKLKQAWSLGYWDAGTIPEFYAVVQYGKHEIEKAKNFIQSLKTEEGQ